MTTIAYKDGMIAYDSRVTSGSIITDDDCDKKVVRDGVKFFLSGPISDYEKFIDVYFGAECPDDMDVMGLVLDKEQLYLVGVDEGAMWKCKERLDGCYAIGSGSYFALTAMDMVATAPEAINMAAKRDTKTGGTVRIYCAY